MQRHFAAVVAAAIVGHAAVLLADDRSVTIEGLKFNPPAITIKAGDTLIFKNADLVPHTITSEEPKRFDSGVVNSGAEWRLKPDDAGTFPYRCLIHPEMKGTIVVVK